MGWIFAPEACLCSSLHSRVPLDQVCHGPGSLLPPLGLSLQPPTFVRAPPQRVPPTGLPSVLWPFLAMSGEFSDTPQPTSEQFVLPSLGLPLQPLILIEAPPQRVPPTGLPSVFRPFLAMSGEFSDTPCPPCTPTSGDSDLRVDEGEDSAIDELVARPLGLLESPDLGLDEREDSAIDDELPQEFPSLDHQQLVNYPISFFSLAEPYT